MVDKAAPLVSIVILNWNGLEDTKLCLKYVRQLSYKNIEIIVVDNGSVKEQKDYLAKIEDIVYVNNPTNRGFAGGQIDGFKHARGDFILLLNNDAIIKHDYLTQAMPLFKDPAVAVVGGRSYFWNDQQPIMDTANQFYSFMEVNVENAETALITHDSNVVQEVNTVSGSSVIVRRSVIEKVGYLYEPFFAYYEETDLFARIKRAGYKVLYSPNLHIWHKNGASSGAQGGSSFFFYHIFRNRFMYALRNFESPYVWKFVRSYYSLGLRSILQIPRGPVQRRLGLAYLKAMCSTFIKLPVTLRERNALRKTISNDYCEQVRREQLKISFVVNATDCADRPSLQKLVDLVSRDNNPNHEYVFVTKKTKGMSESYQGNWRFVLDAGLLQTHALNLGIIAARHDWLVILDPDDLPKVELFSDKVAELTKTSYQAELLTNQSIVFSRQLFRQIGSIGSADLTGADICDQMASYTKSNGLLSTTSVFFENITTQRSMVDQAKIDRLIAEPGGDGFLDKVLRRYYRLQQLAYLLRWLINPRITYRLKLGRLRNLFASSLTLDRKRLATELHHIRNEAIAVGSGEASDRLARHFHDSKESSSGKYLAAEDIPVFIICYERLKDLEVQITWLESVGIKKIILIDNDSSYQPLLDYYAKSPYQVLRLFRNIGHTAPWSESIVRALAPGSAYIVTDPDVIPTTECPQDVISYLSSLQRKYPHHLKVGLGLKIDDLPNTYPLKDSVINWEKQFWENTLEPNVYEAGVDTTFALYRPHSYIYSLHPSIRTGYPYLARHTPWYANPTNLSTEDLHYKHRANSNVTSWNVDELPQRYKKEMQRAKKTKKG